MIREGYYTALGTPLDQEGRLLASSFAKQVDDQIYFDASGLLVMGSMGLGVYVRQQEYVRVAQTAVDAAKGRCTVFVGATDTSIGRVRDRIDALQGLAIDGVVLTAPYYQTFTNTELVTFFSQIARASSFPIYLYDLPVAARNKITQETMQALQAEGNIKGIKTADLDLSHWLQDQVRQQAFAADFQVLYSGLDTFDQAYQSGVTRNLDGMFACTGPLSERLYTQLAAGAFADASGTLKDILMLRNQFAEEVILPSFTHAMNLLGYEGFFHQDFYASPSAAQQEKIKAVMTKIGLL